MIADSTQNSSVRGSAIAETRWLGEPISECTSSLEQIAKIIPQFERCPFGIRMDRRAEQRQTSLFPDSNDPDCNPYLDAIVRLPLDENDVPVPVGVVSKTYNLVQHTDLFDAAVDAIRSANIALDKVKAELTLTTLGGRMGLRFYLPDDYAFDPGDGYKMALRLECFNSVDRSLPLQVMLGWYRFVCSNGLIVGTTVSRMKRLHNDSLDLSDVRMVFSDGLLTAVKEKQSFEKWLSVEINGDRLVKWIDGAVREGWGVLAAARVYHVIRTGYDGSLADRFQSGPPHEKIMVSNHEVPGAQKPAHNAFGVAQALAWVAKENHNVQVQMERVRVIPELMDELLKN